jgi:hypothetical protein
MKKLLSVLSVLSAVIHLSAQPPYTDANGNVGIGTTTPSGKFDVRLPIVTNGIGTVGIFGYGGLTTNRSFVFQQLGNVNTATQYFFLNGALGSSSVLGTPTFTSLYTPIFGFESDDNNLNILAMARGTNMAAYRAMTITSLGNIGIGTTNPGTNRLAVEGTVAARKVMITTTTPFPDYVFKKSYVLLPLDSLERYVRQNSHLPEIPSADSVQKNGLDIGTNQELLLKKIEELTLYVIAQQKELKELSISNERIAKELEEMKREKNK